MTETLTFCLALLADISIKSALLAAIAAGGLRIARVKSSAVRHRAWMIVLIGMLMLPILVPMTPGIAVPSWIVPNSLAISTRKHVAPAMSPAVPVAPIETTIAQERTQTIAATTDTEFESVTPPVSHSSLIADLEKRDRTIEPPPSAAQNQRILPAIWQLALAGIYVAGAAYFLGRLLMAMRRAQLLIRTARPISLRPAHARLVSMTAVLESSAVRVPITVGWRQACILLPQDWPDWSDSLLQSVLAHEQAHVARRDQWVTLLAEFNRAVYWFHPLACFLCNRLSALAEEACDDAVIATTGQRTQYARHLLEVAGRLAGQRGRLELAGVAMARIPQIEHRINAILDAGRPLARTLSVQAALAMIGVATPVLVLIAALQAGAADVVASSDEANRTQARDLESANAKSLATGDESSEATTKPPIKKLRGRVVMESDGQPVAKAQVRLMSWRGNNTRYDVRTAIADDRGEFIFDRVAAGNHRLAAFFGDFSSRNSRYKGHTVDLEAVEPVTLTLARMPSVNVRVVSKADDAPIADALVRLPWSDTTHDHRTDKDGRVTLRCLTPEVWHIEIKAKGFAEREVPVNLVGTDSADVTIELETGGVLFGKITDEAGIAIAGAGFSIFPADHRSGQIEYLRTDGQGNYRFDYLPAAQGLELNVSGSGFLDLREEATLAAGAERKLDLVLRRRPHGGTVTGSVSDAAGNPVAGATLTNRGRSSRDQRTATTDELGIFILDDVFEGSLGHELIVKADGFAPQRVRFSPGTQQAPAKLAITLQAGHRIRGRVVDEAGNAILGVAVYFAEGNSGSGMDFGGKTTTDDNGRFEFDSLPNDCPFKFIADGYSEIEKAMLPLDGDEEVVVTMQSEGIIKGRVVDAATNEPISPFNVQITFSPDRKRGEPGHHLSGPRATSPDGEHFDSRDGTFVLKELIRNMPLQVSVTAEGYDRHVKRRVVAASQADAEIVEFGLERLDPTSFFTIRGRIVDSHERPIAGAELRLISATQTPSNRHPLQFSFVEYPFGWQMIQSGNAEKAAGVKQFLSTTSRQDGEFTFTQVRPAAAMQIVYWGEGVSRGRRQGIELMSAADRENLSIEVVAPGTVRGSIDRASFPKITSIALSPKQLGLDYDFHHAFLTAGNTSYEIRNVPPGSYQLQIYGERVRTEYSDGFTHEVISRYGIEVRPGETLDLDLRAE